jgi:hypothetical protein
VQRETVGVSLVLTAAVLVAAITTGNTNIGAAVGIGLVVGSLNGLVFEVLLDRRAPILPTSILRLAFLSMLALAAARLLGWPVWPLVGGIAAAQLVMAAVGLRQGLRA